MEEPEKPAQGSIAGKPTEWDKIFFDLIECVEIERTEYMTSVSFNGHNGRGCFDCGRMHREVYKFNYLHN